MNTFLAKASVFLLAAVPVLASCDWDDMSDIKAEELGSVSPEYIVEKDMGTVAVNFYSNKKGTIKLLEPVDWATIDVDSFDGDGTINVNYSYNEGFPRMARIVLTTENNERTDTVSIKQKGELTPQISIPNTSAVIYNAAGETKVAMMTNIAQSDMDIKVSYPEGEAGDWITGYTIADGYLHLNTKDNTDQSNLRSATMTFSYLDEWGETLSSTLYLTQANAKNELGVEASFADVRLIGDTDPVTVTSDIYIYAYVVSDKASGNVNDNTQTTTSQIDYTVCEKSAYLESLDGRYGFLVETETTDDNTFTKNTKVQVLLKGCKVTMFLNPERYVITGLTSAKIVSSVAVDASAIPVKEKHMADLTDDDIYTRVTLLDCEFPLRKGSLTPINEGYANSSGANRVNKHPTLIRDINGSSMYLLTNTTCPYRRLGKKLPYGSGKISGILVHERHRRFSDYDVPGAEDEDEYGDIGRYQIRHMALSDIDMADKFESGFSGLITEYNYMKTGSNRYLSPTFGTNGGLIHSYAGFTDASTGMSCKAAWAWPYLGPVGTKASYIFGKNIGNLGGTGILDESGNDLIPPGSNNSSVNSDGKGACTSSCNPATTWSSDYWWNDEAGVGYAWLVYFSTKGYTTNHLSLQISQINSSQSCYTPRYWEVQWAIGNDAPSDNSSSWHYLASYTVPDIVIWSNTLYSQSPAFKTMDFELPLELLGQDRVWIALRPEKNLASTGAAYADAAIQNGKPSNLEYFAVRYNK